MKLDLRNGEKILREGEANHYVERYLIIGRLFLTTQRLVFTAHRINFKHYSVTIPLEALEAVELRNNILFFSHGFWIKSTMNGEENLEHFAVWRRRSWKQSIEEAMQLI